MSIRMSLKLTYFIQDISPMTTQHQMTTPMESEEEFQKYLASLIDVLDECKKQLVMTTLARRGSGRQVMTQQCIQMHHDHLFDHLDNAYHQRKGVESSVGANTAHTVFRAILFAHAWCHAYEVSPRDLFDDNARKF